MSNALAIVASPRRKGLVSTMAQRVLDAREAIEERFCLERYGQAYRDYMEQVPRHFLFF